MVLFVKVLSRPRKNGSKGTFLIQTGEKKGEVAKYVLGDPGLKDIFVVNALCAVECELLEENVYLVYKIVDFALTASDSDLLEAADLLGVRISADTYWKCLGSLGAKTFAEALEAVSTPGGTALLEGLVGPDAAGEFLSLAAAEHRLTPYAKASTEQLIALFQESGLGGAVDRTLLWRTVKSLRFRAARNRMSVADLVKKWPWVLVQAWENKKAALEVADLLAEALGLAPEKISVADAAARAIIYLYEEANKGHCFAWKNKVTVRMMAGGLDFDTVNEEAWNTLLSRKGVEQFGGVKLLEKHMVRVASETRIYPRKDWSPLKDKDKRVVPGVYLPKIFFAEIKSAQYLPEKLYKGDTVPLDPDLLVHEARKYAAEEGKMLDPDQESFIAAVARNRVTVLEGEAGTGKTYALKVLIGALNRSVPGLVPAVIAPTALAAYRAAENTVSEDAAMTVHRYAWFYEEDSDLAVLPAADLRIASQLRMPGVVVVDECSMLGPVLLQKIFSATENGTRFVFAGDPAQLPPVGPGGTYPALIRLAKEGVSEMAHCELKTNYGVKSSEVTAAACAVRRGHPLPASSAVRVVYVRDHFEAAKKCGEVARSITGDRYDPSRLLILAPTRTKGKAGTDVLNGLLAREFASGRHLIGPYCIGTPVIARKNDYAVRQGATPDHRWLNRHPARGDVYNGTRGVIEKVIVNSKTEVFVSYRKGRKTVLEPYYLEELSYFLEPAYAVTVHKAQGARAENIVLVLLTALAHRSMLYTALTRCGSDSGTVTIITTKDFAGAPYADEGWEDKVAEREEEVEVLPKVLSAFYYLAEEEIKNSSYRLYAEMGKSSLEWMKEMEAGIDSYEPPPGLLS